MGTELPDPVFVLRKEEEVFHSLLFTNMSETEQLLSGTGGGTVVTWDLMSGRPSAGVDPLKTGTSTCLSLDTVSGSLVTQNKDGTVKVWTASDSRWTCVRKAKLSYFGFCRVEASEELGGVLVCPREKSGVEVFDANSLERVASFRPEETVKVGEVMACKVVKRLGILYLLAAFESGDLTTWDFRSSKVVSQMKVTGSNCPMALDYDSVHGRGFVGSNADTVVVFKTDEGMRLSVRHEFVMKSEGVSSIRIRHDRKVFAVGSWDGKVRLFACKTCRPLACFDVHRSTVHDMAFCPFPVLSQDSKHLLAAAAKDGRISLLDVGIGISVETSF